MINNLESWLKEQQNPLNLSVVAPYATSDDFMDCNITCCSYQDAIGQGFICFDEHNFTEIGTIKEPPATWELALRWSLVIPVVFLGVFGNLAIVIILFKNRLLMRTSVNYFILNMAVADLILSAAGPIPFTIRDTHQFWVLGEVWCHLDGFIQITVMTVSVLSLSTISIDRVLGILYPMHRHLRHWQAVLITTFIWVFGGMSAIPFYIYRNYGERQWMDVKETYCDEMTENTWIYWIIIIIVLSWMPLTIMLLSYIKLFIGFHKHALKVEGKEHPGILRTKKKLAKMLFAMIILFQACWFPFQAFALFREKLIISDDSHVSESEEKAYSICFTVAQYIIYLNPAINPFIYGLMHDNFRKGFRVSFSCFYKSKNFSQILYWCRATEDEGTHGAGNPSFATRSLTRDTKTNARLDFSHRSCPRTRSGELAPLIPISIQG